MLNICISPEVEPEVTPKVRWYWVRANFWQMKVQGKIAIVKNKPHFYLNYISNQLIFSSYILLWFPLQFSCAGLCFGFRLVNAFKMVISKIVPLDFLINSIRWMILISTPWWSLPINVIVFFKLFKPNVFQFKSLSEIIILFW